MDRRRFSQSLLLFSVGLGGCKSIESRLLDRDPATSETCAIKLEGYPITLKVPTHLRITLYENSFLEESRVPDLVARKQGGENANAMKSLGWQVISVNGQVLRTVTYSTQLIETEKIFVVDHKRPAAGQNKYGVNFTDDQYIDQISSAATEDTIRQSSIALSRAVTLMSGQGVAARTADDSTRLLAQGAFTSVYGDALSTKVRPVPAVVRIGTDELPAKTNAPKTTSIPTVLATQVFETDGPEFELSISAFLRDTLGCRSN